MAKKKKIRRRPKTTLPVAVLVGTMPLVGSVIRGAKNGYYDPNDNPIRAAGKEALFALTGYDTDQSGWHPEFMKNGTFPLLAGILVHKLAGGLGINRALGRARVPYLRI